MLLSKFSVCNSKKSKYLKEQKAKGILSRIRTPSSQFRLIVHLLF